MTNQRQVFISLLALLIITSCATVSRKEYAPPLWIESGKDIRYHERLYITGAGEGESKDVADSVAKHKIAAQILVDIKSRLIAVQSERAKGGKIESSHDVTLSTEASVDIRGLEGLSIVSRYFDENKKLHHSLALLDREKASAGLEREVKESYELAKKYFEIAEGYKDKKEIAGVIQNYAKAIAEFKRIRPRENILRAISGREIKNEMSVVDVEKKLAEVLSMIKVSVEIRVNNIGMALKSKEITSMITEGLAGLGFKAVSEDSRDADVLIKGEVNSTKKGEDSGIVYAQSRASISVLDNKTNEVIKAVNVKPINFKGDTGADTKASGATLESAGLNSIKKIGDVIKDAVVTAFRDKFMGKGGD